MKKLILIILSIVCSTETIAQNKVLYFQTSWGFEGTPESFIKKAKASGYDGILTMGIAPDNAQQCKMGKQRWAEGRET